MQKIIDRHLYDTDLAREVANAARQAAEDKLSRIAGCPLTQTEV